MTKMDLDKSYRYEGAAYGPGQGLEIPDDVAKKIKAFQKKLEKDGDGDE